MTGRTVSVTLTAQISGYLASMQRASAATSAFAGRASAGITKHEESLNRLSRGAGIVGIALAAGFVAAAGAAANFDQKMSAVAATGDDARQNLTALREAAIKAGADTKFSAGEAAGGLEALAKAGVSAKDSLGGGLSGALNLAAAGNLDVAGSAEAAATAMTQFKLSGKDVPHIADLLAAGAGKAQGEVSDMAMALKQSGLVASQFGLSIEETTGTLAAFASAGLIGSDAGTSFKTMLLALASPSKLAAGLMDKLGIAAYDTRGNFVGIANLADQLKNKLGPLSQAQRDAALSTIFGNDAIRAANVLFNQGSSGITQWINNVNDSGFAARTAATKMDNLKGDLEQLRGSFETALIGLGEGAAGPLRDLVQTATDAVNAFNNLGAGSKSALLAVVGGLAGVALGAAGLAKVVIFANQAKVALAALGISAKVAGIAMFAVTAGLAVAAGIYGHFAAQAAVSKQTIQDFTTALQSQTSAITANVTAVAAKSLQDSGALTAARQLGLNLTDVTQAALGNSSAMARVQSSLSGVDAAFQASAGSGKKAGDVYFAAAQDQQIAANLVRTAIGGTTEEFNKAVQAAKDLAQANGQANTSVTPDIYQQAADALGRIGQEGGSAAGEVRDLASALFELGDAAQTTADAERGFHEAVLAAKEAVKQNGKTLSDNTRAGLANQEALSGLAHRSKAYISSLVEAGASTKKVEGATKDARKAFIATATQMTGSRTKAIALANAFGLVPKDVKTKVSTEAQQSKAELKLVKAAISGLPKSTQTKVLSAFKRGGIDAANAALAGINGKSATVTVTTIHRTIYQTHVSKSGQGTGGGLAAGGPVAGPGTATSDSIPAMLSDGEFVIKAASVKAIGVDRLLHANAHGELPKFAQGGLVGYAAGGSVNTNWIQSLIRAIENPLGKVASAANAVAAATAKGKAGADKLADAQQKLRDQVQAVADSARQVAETFRNQFAGQGTDPFAWLTTMRSGAADISAFNSQLGKLRKGGLSETLLQQLIGMGAGAGGAAASGILGGGPNLVKALNAASAGLQTAADKLGYLGATGKGRYAYGGPVTGAGTATSDSVPIMASTGEWVVPAHAVPANRPALEAMTYGRTVVSHNFARGYAYGGMVQRSNIDMGAVQAALAGMRVYVENPWTGEYHEARMRGVAGNVMEHETSRAVGAF